MHHAIYGFIVFLRGGVKAARSPSNGSYSFTLIQRRPLLCLSTGTSC